MRVLGVFGEQRAFLVVAVGYVAFGLSMCLVGLRSGVGTKFHRNWVRPASGCWDALNVVGN